MDLLLLGGTTEALFMFGEDLRLLEVSGLDFVDDVRLLLFDFLLMPDVSLERIGDQGFHLYT